jgi:hypothetical protein
MPDAWITYIGAQRLCLKVWRKKFTNLEKQWSTLKSGPRGAAEVHHNGRSVGYFKARNEGASIPSAAYQSRGSGSDPEAGQPHGIGLIKMSETERNRHFEKICALLPQARSPCQRAHSRQVSREMDLAGSSPSGGHDGDGEMGSHPGRRRAETPV